MADNKAIEVAVVGASGYSGEELLRLLLRHPHCRLRTVTSRQHAGHPVAEVFPRFADHRLNFTAPEAQAIAASAEVAFLALPHGLAAEFARPLLAAGLTVIDISADFRIRDPGIYRSYYQAEHPAPELLAEAVYGLPERYREKICRARLIACPGCYPTSIILAAAPLLAAGAIRPESIIVASMSGVTGAGRKVDLPYLFPECNESLRAYAPTGHRHLPEIEQELAVAAGLPRLAINFVPHLVPVNRGINSTLFLQPLPGVDQARIAEVYAQAYADEPFVRVLPPGRMADTKNVTMTNRCEIGFALDAHTGRLVVTAAIDNLTKGAAGQAVQCCNLRHGFPESCGLE